MTYICPNCGEIWREDILDQIGDIGCPSCRRCFDLDDLTSIEEDLYDPQDRDLDTDIFGNCFSDADPGL